MSRAKFKDRIYVWNRCDLLEGYKTFRISGTDERSRRGPADLPPEEIANAALYILGQQIALPLEDLVRETARVFGFLRTGQNVSSYINDGIMLLLKKGEALETDGKIVLK